MEVLLTMVAWAITSGAVLVACCMVVRNLHLSWKVAKLQHLATARLERAKEAEEAARAWEERALVAEALIDADLEFSQHSEE